MISSTNVHSVFNSVIKFARLNKIDKTNTNNRE